MKFTDIVERGEALAKAILTCFLLQAGIKSGTMAVINKLDFLDLHG